MSSVNALQVVGSGNGSVSRQDRVVAFEMVILKRLSSLKAGRSDPRNFLTIQAIFNGRTPVAPWSRSLWRPVWENILDAALAGRQRGPQLLRNREGAVLATFDWSPDLGLTVTRSSHDADQQLRFVAIHGASIASEDRVIAAVDRTRLPRAFVIELGESDPPVYFDLISTTVEEVPIIKQMTAPKVGITSYGQPTILDPYQRLLNLARSGRGGIDPKKFHNKCDPGTGRQEWLSAPILNGVLAVNSRYDDFFSKNLFKLGLGTLSHHVGIFAAGVSAIPEDQILIAAIFYARNNVPIKIVIQPGRRLFELVPSLFECPGRFGVLLNPHRKEALTILPASNPTETEFVQMYDSSDMISGMWSLRQFANTFENPDLTLTVFESV